MGKMQLPDDFRDFFRFLNESGVEYLLIGGWAVGFHGYPRATADMDVWVACDPENAKRIVHALKLFGFTSRKLQRDFSAPQATFRIHTDCPLQSARI